MTSTAHRPTSFMWRDAGALLALAWPMIITYAGVLTINIVDTIMVGQYDSLHLAYFGVGLVPSNILWPVLIGLLLGVRVLVSNLYGAERFGETGAVMWQAMGWALFLGLGGFAICAAGEQLLALSGQTPEIAERGGRIAFIAGLSLPFVAINLTISFFLEGIRRPYPAMVIMLVSNVVNIIANYMLVYGHWGAPELGAEGAVWASFIVRSVQFAAYLTYIWCMHDEARYGIRRPSRRTRETGAQLRQIGYAGGLSMSVENGAFNALALFAGLIGIAAIGAHVINIMVFSLFFMFGLGVGMATAVRVGNSYGANDAAGVAYWAWLGLTIQTILMVGVAAFVYVFSESLAAFFTADPAVMGLAAAMVAYSAVAMIFDTGQSLFAISLRARGDTWMPTLVHAFSYLGVMIPVAWFACFHLDRGVFGLVDAMIVGSVLPFSLLAWRYRRLDRRGYIPAAA